MKFERLERARLSLCFRSRRHSEEISNETDSFEKNSFERKRSDEQESNNIRIKRTQPLGRASRAASRFFTLNYDTSDRASLLIRALTRSFFPKTHSNPGVRDSPLPPGTCQPHSQTADRPCGPLNSRSGGDCRWTCLPPGVIYTRTTISNTSKKRRIGASYRDFNVNTVGK